MAPRMKHLYSILAPILATALLAPGAAAQTCGVGTTIAPVGGYADFRIADGTSGPQLGADLDVDAGPVGLRLSGRTVRLDGDAPDPVLGRAEARIPIVALEGIAICGGVLAGASRFSVADDAATVLAGGLGLTLVPAGSGAGVFRPWLSVRGLAGWTTGTILGLDVSESALALGVEAGVEARLGSVSLRLTGARDGFDEGMGAPPYPAISAELALGYHF